MTTPAGAVAGNAAAAQREAGQREQVQQGGGFFGRKYGPLKGWQWSIAAGGVALVYFWWRSRKKAQVTGTSVSGTGTGLQAEINNFYGTFNPPPTGTTTATTGTSPGGGTKVKVPNVVGMEVDAAQRALAAANLKWTRSPLKPGQGYHVTGQTPKAGAQVKPGSSVALSIKANAKGKGSR